MPRRVTGLRQGEGRHRLGDKLHRREVAELAGDRARGDANCRVAILLVLDQEWGAAVPAQDGAVGPEEGA